MLTPGESYSSLRSQFAWSIPPVYNIGVDTVDRHASDPRRLALIYEQENGRVDRHTFADIKKASDSLALALRGLGIHRGDRVSILLPQAPGTAITHAAIYKLGAVALPLFTLFGPDALRFRLKDSGARVVVTDPANLDKAMDLRRDLSALETIICTGVTAPREVHAFDALLGQAHGAFEPVRTAPDDPSLIIYTSGTTGNLKGALHAHRVRCWKPLRAIRSRRSAFYWPRGSREVWRRFPECGKIMKSP